MNIILATHQNNVLKPVFTKEGMCVVFAFAFIRNTLWVNIYKICWQISLYSFQQIPSSKPLNFMQETTAWNSLLGGTSQSIISPNQQFCYFQHASPKLCSNQSVSKEGSIVSFFQFMCNFQVVLESGLIKSIIYL